MPMDLTGQVALVTGGASGIGRGPPDVCGGRRAGRGSRRRYGRRRRPSPRRSVEQRCAATSVSWRTTMLPFRWPERPTADSTC